MIYYSSAELDALLLEDISRGDLTTRALMLEGIPAHICFIRRSAGIVAGMDVAAALLQRLDIQYCCHCKDGEWVGAGSVLLEADADAERLHQAWKVIQTLLEWSCGVAQYTAETLAQARKIRPDAVLACTRKSIPNTRKLAMSAVVAGGATLHRQGLGETLLVFENHRNLCGNSEDWGAVVARLRLAAPEHKVIIEADHPDQLSEIIRAAPDIIQLDKFSPQAAHTVLAQIAAQKEAIRVSVAGGIGKHNIAEYAALGISLFVTSAPYYAPPQDIKGVLTRRR